MKLIVGLGNPGAKYSLTRHNIGFIALDYYAKQVKTEFVKKSNYLYFKTDNAVFVKPLTYMNLSGQAVCEAAGEFLADEVLVISDDIYLPFGSIRLRQKGSDGGHNGLKSIITELDSTDFKRFKIGVGAANSGNGSLPDFVLSDFSTEEQAKLDLIGGFAAEILEAYVKDGFEKALNYYSKHNKSYSEEFTEGGRSVVSKNNKNAFDGKKNMTQNRETEGGKMKDYESMIVIDPDLTTEDAEKRNTAILALIKEEGGEITETDSWGKRRLAYEIKKKRDGYYFVNYFKINPQKLDEIERTYKLSEEILRYNILVKH